MTDLEALDKLKKLNSDDAIDQLLQIDNDMLDYLKDKDFTVFSHLNQFLTRLVSTSRRLLDNKNAFRTLTLQLIKEITNTRSNLNEVERQKRQAVEQVAALSAKLDTLDEARRKIGFRGPAKK